MPGYRNEQIELAARLNDRAREVFAEGTEARETADRYVRLTVLFATVLFLVAVSQRFTYHVVRLAANGLAAVIMILALIGVVALPRL
jgi:predicted ferric reductase